MIEIEKPRIETAELTEDGKYGRFVVEPLERGFGKSVAFTSVSQNWQEQSAPGLAHLCCSGASGRRLAAAE